MNDKPTLIATEENARGPWALAIAVSDCLEQAEQKKEASSFNAKLSLFADSATEDKVLELASQFVNIETEQSQMAKTRAANTMPEVDLVAASEAATALETDAAQTSNYLETYEILTDDDYKAAAEMCAEVITQAKSIDTQRRSFVDPLNKVVKSLNAFFKKPLIHLDACEALLKKKLAAFANQQAIERDRLLKEAGAQAQDGDMAQTEALIERAEEHTAPKVEGVSMRTTWDGVVVDEKLIPREYMTPDLKALKAVTKAKGRDPEIPGWKATPKSSPAITASKLTS